MAAVTEVQRLQARVEELERWVYGPGGSRGSRKVADGLVKVQVALGNIASKRERVKILYKKIEDLIKYLDPEYIDRIAIPDASKLQFILAEEQFILSQVALLEQVEALVPMLDSAHIKAVPEHAAHLQRLAQIHIQQQDQCVEVTEESKALLEEYNKTVSFLLSQAQRCAVQSPVLLFHLRLCLSSHPNQPVFHLLRHPFGRCKISPLPHSDPCSHLDLRPDNASLQAIRAVG
ncbi:PREDICTED: dynactin subunit 3 isoform X1 [Ceratotherium simum simum]|uniref:Dynactin subunit 3 isoform X1 n=1 Tax=Ceratotherium simum simum TaxID=73337 RepID=A0ABM0HJM1_CERSS|nr:PREDICTED: dynactin subunit 3 isoform X1 [Ceratotherium simum simum]